MVAQVNWTITTEQRISLFSSTRSVWCRPSHLNGHIDVVPPGDRKWWSVDPFEGVVNADEGRVYGCGASDMKSGVAAGILAAREMANEGIDETLTLIFAVGEETTEPGTKTLVENRDAD